ncbi:MAG TPA: riboflavin synthase [Vicinamibacterales bacterium]|nr:riboflavin synthase [Vicinamibacterales bacterium]
MFSGIVQAVGEIEKVEPLQAGVRLTIDAGALDLTDTTVGDSIAVNGACMTATSVSANRFTVDVSRESLDVTAGLGAPGRVNLEKAMKLEDRIDGHLVTGHVDGVGEVSVFESLGESTRLTVRVPRDLARYVARKGSVTVDGVSLTVNSVDDEPSGTTFEVNLIPHTLRVTTLSRLAPGTKVNLEIDLLARYMERMLSAPK